MDGIFSTRDRGHKHKKYYFRKQKVNGDYEYVSMHA